ncbi:hypothetical protein COCOBI_02-8750 [Coccomyxa sp. Obi]|nr:hypothetical protein COCOBI_02-8750 [Coccomyxa sp. Obi]
MSAFWHVKDDPAILQGGQDTLGSIINAVVHIPLDALANGKAKINAKFHPSTTVVPQTTLPTGVTVVRHHWQYHATDHYRYTASLYPASLHPAPDLHQIPDCHCASFQHAHGDDKHPLSDDDHHTKHHINLNTNCHNHPSWDNHPAFNNTLPSTTPFTNSCLNSPGASACYINVTVNFDTANTTVDQCADPVTCQCTPTSTATVCTAANGLCVSTPSDYLQCEPFKFCAAPPLTLGFEDATAGGVNNPFPYDGFNFSASSDSIETFPVTLEIVDSTTELFPAIASGAQAFESSFGQKDSRGSSLLSLDIVGNTNIGPFVAVSGYINAVDYNGISGMDITVTGSFNGTDQPSCKSGVDGFGGDIGTPGDMGSPVKVTFANATDTCIVDLLSLQTEDAFGTGGSTVPTFVRFSLDDFVVCKANTTGLQGALPTT